MGGLIPFFNQTHNYTGEQGPIDSPRVPVCWLWSLAKGHRSLSERGIIATKGHPSSLIPLNRNYFRALSRRPSDDQAGRQKTRFFRGKRPDFLIDRRLIS